MARFAVCKRPLVAACCLLVATALARAQVIEPDRGGEGTTEFALFLATANLDVGEAEVDFLFGRAEGDLEGTIAGVGVSKSISSSWTGRIAYFGYFQEDIERPDPQDDRLRVEATWSGEVLGRPVSQRLRVERRFRDVEDETRFRPETTIDLPAIGPAAPYVSVEPFLSDQDGFEQVLLEAGATLPIGERLALRPAYAYGIGSGQPDTSLFLVLLQLKR